MSQFASDPELEAVESALGRLVPVPSRLDRDQLMFQAGTISARSSGPGFPMWPSTAAVLAIVVALESVLLAVRPAPRVLERIVVVREPAPASTTTIPQPALATISSQALPNNDALSQPAWAEGSDYQRLLEQVVRFGLDALPERPPLLSRSDGESDSDDRSFEPAGALRRLELEKLLNPGGPS
jgi:hypothetical protein